MKEKVTGKLIKIGTDFVVIENEGRLPTEYVGYRIKVGDEVDAILGKDNKRYVIELHFYRIERFICPHCKVFQIRCWPHPTGNVCNWCQEYMDGEPT